MNKITITKKQARRFMLMKQGLYGDKIFSGKQGIYDYIKQASCIQYDPIDVCGKNHELVLQSRVKGFEKHQLFELLYKERKLFDWLDKCMCICLTSDWPYFKHERDRTIQSSRNKSDIDKVANDVLDFIKEKGPVCSSDLEYKHKIDWYWAPTSFSRAILDTLYKRGELVFSHKKNTRKYYDLTSRHIQKELINAVNPNRTDIDILKWHVLRRIGSVGMLHNNSSYAFIGIRGLKAKERKQVYADLIEEGIVNELMVDGIVKPFYFEKSDEHILEKAISSNETSNRIEFIAPLDNLLWDRKIVEEVFEFSYKWEIYTPIVDRKYGYYVLPILFDDSFVGRIELRRNKEENKFEMKNIWWENEENNSTDLLQKIEDHTKEFSDMMY
ncbi:MAG: winged helix DNA-binding domain-containing protein [Clostridiales bacterium]|nr:winged helix DNA-binding domain-containing protein [Clostridiales bacterium]